MDRAAAPRRACGDRATSILRVCASGAYLALRGDRDDDPRLLGFGRSLMFQGAFRFTFDIALFAAHGLRTLKFWKILEVH